MLRGCPNAWKTAAFIDGPRRTQMEQFSPQQALLLRRAHELAADREPGRILEAADQPPDPAPCKERDQHRGDAEHDHVGRAVLGEKPIGDEVDHGADMIGPSMEPINRALSTGIENAKSLANALAGVAPHVVGKSCPVCDRNFGELDQGPLSAHIAAKIASLTKRSRPATVTCQ